MWAFGRCVQDDSVSSTPHDHHHSSMKAARLVLVMAATRVANGKISIA